MNNANLLSPPTASQDRARAEALLAELVDLSSATTEIEGVQRLQDVLARELTRLGFQIRLQRDPRAGSRADLLIACLKGERPEFITMVSHADTVLPNAACGPYRIDDRGRAYGSGVIDNKGGLVVALEALRRLREELGSRRPPLSIRFVSSPNEEAGSLGFHDAFRGFAEDSVLILGFEPALEGGSIIESRRGNRWYDIRVAGQEAHAGRCRGEQINAAHDFAMKIAELHSLNDLEAGVSVNIGHIEGGRDRHNIVCGEVFAKLDTRFASFAARERLHATLDACLTAPRLRSPITGRGTVTTYEIVDDCPPFSKTERARPAIEFLISRIQALEGRPIAATRAGGAGDVNYMSREDSVVIDGLGPIGGFMHTPHEFIELSSLQTRATAVAELLSSADSLVPLRVRA